MLVRNLYINKLQSDEFGSLSGSGLREEKYYERNFCPFVAANIARLNFCPQKRNKKQERHMESR